MQYRPYQVGPAVAIAAVWTRDGAEFRLTEGATADELRRRDAEWRAKGFLPLDVASYRTDSGLRHAALWTRKDPAVVDVRLYVEVSAADHVAAWKPLQTDGFVPRTQTQVDGEGGPRHSGVWWKPASPFELNYYNFRFTEAVYEKSLSPSRLETDVRLEREVPPEPVDRTDQFCQQLATAETALADRPNDGNLRWQRAWRWPAWAVTPTPRPTSTRCGSCSRARHWCCGSALWCGLAWAAPTTPVPTWPPTAR